MCGLTAWISPQGWPAGELRLATDLIRHRGPDDEGFLTWTGRSEDAPEVWSGADSVGSIQRLRPPVPNNAVARIALGHRRLSIVDLSDAGHQPMPSRDRTCWVAYNGEIYNHVELRGDLERLGHQFDSVCDTEVLLAAWQQWDVSCLARFNGMFAFVLLDTRRELLFAARDRFGVKPLYIWTAPDGTIVLASEIKQFTALPGWKARLNGPRLYDMLNWRLLDHSAETCFDGVLQMLPGQYVRVDLKGLLTQHPPRAAGLTTRPRTWYALTPRHAEASLTQSAEWFRDLFADSVRLHLRGDVPVGCLLSGGLDSSAIACVAARLLKDKAAFPRTYSACSTSPRFDESRWAKMIVEHTGAKGAFLYPEPDGLLDSLAALVWHHDEPFDSHAIYAYWRLMQQVRSDGVKVVLNGQGADEQLGGYPPFIDVRLAGLLRDRRVASFAREARAFANSQGCSGARLALKTLGRIAPAVLGQTARLLNGSQRPSWLNWRRLVDRPEDPLQRLGVRSGDVLSLSLGQLRGANLQMLLHYEDRLSMAHSVVVRVPFLDHRLVEGVTGLAEDHKLAGGELKRVLREAMRGIMPEPVRRRPDKQGFLAPLEQWMRHDVSGRFSQVLREAIGENSELFGKGTERFVEQAPSGARRSALVPWRILNFAAWRRRFDVALP